MSALGAYRALTGCAEAMSTPWRLWARRAGGARAERFGYGDARGATWIHAASVGEVAAATPLLRALAAHRPADELLVSAGTRGGLEAWRRELERRPTGGPPVAVAAWPLDLPGAVRRALAARRPRRLLVVETEIWPNALDQALSAGVRVAFANARLSARRWPRTRLLRPVVAPLLARVAACAAQTEADRGRWEELGVPHEALAVTGNTKHDLLPAAPDPAARAGERVRLGMPADRDAWVWGSVRPGEEKALAEAAHALARGRGPGGRAVELIAVPRHPQRAGTIAARLGRLGVRVVEWRPGAPWPADGATDARDAPGARPRVVLAPVLGVLRDLYAVADIATVGGSFAGYGGHNPAEPAALGVPVLVGPHADQVEEVVSALVRRGGGHVATDGRDAAERALGWLRDPAARQAAGGAARRAVEGLAGASLRTLGYLEARGFWG